MVRLNTLPHADRAHLQAKPLPEVGKTAWQPSRALSESRVALLTTSGIGLRSDQRFELRDTTYRVIPGEVEAKDLVMSHASVNFDRTAFQLDLNVAFPIDRLRELEAGGEIGSLAN